MSNKYMMLRTCLIGLIAVASTAHAESSSDLLKRLVEINSGSKNVAGVNSVQSFVDGELKGLGFTVERSAVDSGSRKTGDVVMATFAGVRPEFVSMIVHADTVFEESSGFTQFKVEGDRARGPGVIDDKGGIVVLLGGLRAYLKDVPKPLYSLRVIVSPSEEVGSPGLKERFVQCSRDSKIVLGFEPALETGNIVSSRRGNRWYLVEVEGREAHAGRAHAQGVNACVELAEKLTQMAKLTDYKRNVTVSVGHIEGGQDKFNIVCGKASAKVDTRFATLKDGDLLHAKILKILSASSVRAASDQAPSKITYKVESESPAFSLEKSAQTLVKLYAEIASRIEGKAITHEISGGSADSNEFARPGLAIIDGLGPVGGKMHTPEEFIVLSSLDTRAQALAEFLRTLK